MGKFVLKKSADDRYMFNLLATNGQIICTSQMYVSESAAKNGIESVRRNAGAHVEDQTVSGAETKLFPKWELYKDKAGEYRFRLSASNGETIVVGQGYKTKANAKGGIESVRRNAPCSGIIEEYA